MRRGTKYKLLAAGIFCAICALIFLRIMDTNQYYEDRYYYYTEDYPKLYREELEALCGSSMAVGEKRDEVDALEWFYPVQTPAGATSGEAWDIYNYYEWQVSYEDSLGRTCTQTLNNKDKFDLGSLQFAWLENQLTDYYTECYLKEFLPGNVQWQHEWECSVRARIMGSGDFARASRIWTGLYRTVKGLEKGKKVLALDQVDYRTVFRQYPLFLYFHVEIDAWQEAGMRRRQREEAEEAEAALLAMAEAIHQDTEGGANLCICLDFAGEYKGERIEESTSWYWIGGVDVTKEAEAEGYLLEKAVIDSCK